MGFLVSNWRQFLVGVGLLYMKRQRREKEGHKGSAMKGGKRSKTESKNVRGCLTERDRSC